MAQRSDPVGLRPMLPQDVAVLAAIFAASVEQLTEDDYSESQREAWASAADDEAAFGKRLSSQLTLVATLGGSAVGFASLKGADLIDMLYVHPDATGQGVATALCDALEKLAAARDAKVMRAEVSDTAEEFFKKRGYSGQQRNSISMGDEWLANTTMAKPLTAEEGEQGTLQ